MLGLTWMLHKVDLYIHALLVHIIQIIQDHVVFSLVPPSDPSPSSSTALSFLRNGGKPGSVPSQLTVFSPSLISLGHNSQAEL